jgi:hypothetical protein
MLLVSAWVVEAPSASAVANCYRQRIHAQGAVR